MYRKTKTLQQQSKCRKKTLICNTFSNEMLNGRGSRGKDERVK